MGVAISDLLVGKSISLKDLKGKVIAIDAYNALFQFLTVLRGPDGTPLQNSEGKITSHLQGLLSRNLQFLVEGVKPVYVFDGVSPELKKKERARRRSLKDEAKRQYEIARDRNDIENMRKYSARMVSVDSEIIESSKKLLDLMGIPHIDAPSEGEAQAAYMVKHGFADYVVSQDADTLLFGAPNLIRNLSNSKKKVRGKLSSKSVEPMVYSLEDTLEKLKLSMDQFIALGVLVGTDFNVGGVKGLGPKKSIKVVQERGDDFEGLFSSVAWDTFFDFSWKEVFKVFKECPVQEDIKLEWNDVNISGLEEYLELEYGFSRERVEKMLGKLFEIESKKKQKGLGDFF